jgi:hypothetical protein
MPPEVIADIFRKHKKKGTTFIRMKVGGEAIFSGALFEAPVDFNFSEFVLLDLSNASWPEVYMQGMSYKYIQAVPGSGNAPKSRLMTNALQGA